MILHLLQTSFFLLAIACIDVSSSQFTQTARQTSWSPYRNPNQYNRGIQSLFTCPAHELARDMNTCAQHVPWERRPKILRTMNIGDASDGFISYKHYFSDATDQTCSRMVDYYKVLACQYKAINNCLPGNHQALLPQLEQLTEGMQFLCNSHSNLNRPCLEMQISNLDKCILHAGFDNPQQLNSSTLVQNTCRSHQYAVDCVAKSFLPCGDQALDVYKQAMDYVKPMVCRSVCHLANLLLVMACLLVNVLGQVV